MEGDHLRFIDRAEEVDQVAEFCRDPATVPIKGVEGVVGEPAAPVGEPRGSVKWCKVTNERIPVARNVSRTAR